MNFSLPVEIYIRLSKTVQIMPENVTEYEKTVLKCIRIENKNGHAYAIACNRKIAAIYYLGTTANADGIAHIIIDPALLKQCNAEKPFASKLEINVIEALQIVTIKTTMGYTQPGNSGLFPKDTPLDDWRNWVPDEMPTVPNGAMFINSEMIASLNEASPSGKIVFPLIIDVDQPIVLRDVGEPNWLGLFMANRANEKGEAYQENPATLPSWLNV